MAEETKVQQTEQESQKATETLKMILKIILGVVLILVALWLIFGLKWWRFLWIVFKGCIGPFLILVGAIIIAIARE